MVYRGERFYHVTVTADVRYADGSTRRFTNRSEPFADQESAQGHARDVLSLIKAETTRPVVEMTRTEGIIGPLLTGGGRIVLGPSGDGDQVEARIFVNLTHDDFRREVTVPELIAKVLS